MAGGTVRGVLYLVVQDGKGIEQQGDMTNAGRTLEDLDNTTYQQLDARRERVALVFFVCLFVCLSNRKKMDLIF